MSELRDIEVLDDVKAMVDQFYGKIRQDDLLKDIFNNIIQDNWQNIWIKCIVFGKLFCCKNELITEDRLYRI